MKNSSNCVSLVTYEGGLTCSSCSTVDCTKPRMISFEHMSTGPFSSCTPIRLTLTGDINGNTRNRGKYLASVTVEVEVSLLEQRSE